MNNGNKQNRTFFIVLVIFAIIGLISLIGLGVFGLVKIKEKITTKAEKPQEVTLVELNEVDSFKKDENNSAQVVEEHTSGSGNTVAETLSDVVVPETNASEVEDEVELDPERLQIVFLGDSILDNFRDETGIVYLVGEALDADVINLAIGGTSASIGYDNDKSDEKWDSTSGAGVAKAICGIVSPDVLFDCTAKTLIKSHMDDFKNTDIFVIEYGINDFMYGRAMVDLDDLTNPTTYEGALRQMLNAITQTYPNAKIVTCQPSYVEFFRENGEYVGNSYVLNNGPGTEYDYGRKMEMLSKEYGTYFFSFEDNGITMGNASETLLDGVHLNENGRRIYAENLSEFIRDNIINAGE